ncbi:MAG: vanadium-dependent haloperoxidase, partial [Gemmatimonadaceae bacterium]
MRCQRTLTSLVLPALLTLSACSDSTTVVPTDPSAARSAAASAHGTAATNTLSTVRWNQKGIALFRARGGSAVRIDAYLAVAQYRAVLAAAHAPHGHTRPSLAGAAAGASVVVLEQFYALDSAGIDAALAAQRVEPRVGEEQNLDFAAGEAIGRAIGNAVLAQAANDNFGLTSPGVPPVGPGYWVSSAAPIVSGGFGARPFFLTSGSELRAPPPPAFGSAPYLAALAEVRAFADNRTAAQVANTRFWVPFSGVVFNGLATDLIDRYDRSELESARILAYGNAAAYDAIIACFDSKFAYWFIRPTQADPGITLATGLPNHPSYPSAHSCESGAFATVLKDAFPAERTSLDSIAQDASMSRVIGGLHYRFDGDGGL